MDIWAAHNLGAAQEYGQRYAAAVEAMRRGMPPRPTGTVVLSRASSVAPHHRRVPPEIAAEEAARFGLGVTIAYGGGAVMRRPAPILPPPGTRIGAVRIGGSTPANPCAGTPTELADGIARAISKGDATARQLIRELQGHGEYKKQAGVAGASTSTPDAAARALLWQAWGGRDCKVGKWERGAQGKLRALAAKYAAAAPLPPPPAPPPAVPSLPPARRPTFGPVKPLPPVPTPTIPEPREVAPARRPTPMAPRRPTPIPRRIEPPVEEDRRRPPPPTFGPVKPLPPVPTPTIPEPREVAPGVEPMDRPGIPGGVRGGGGPVPGFGPIPEESAPDAPPPVRAAGIFGGGPLPMLLMAGLVLAVATGKKGRR